MVGLEPTHTSIFSPVLRSGIMALPAVIFSVKAWQVVGLEPTHTSISPVLRSDIMALPAVFILYAAKLRRIFDICK